MGSVGVVESSPASPQRSGKPARSTAASRAGKPLAKTPRASSRSTTARAGASARPAPAPVVLEVRGLRKSFGGTVAVDDASFTVRRGSIFGFVGPNGAGKTTTLSIITGLLRPDAGQVVVGGTDVWREPTTAKRKLGVLPDRMRLFDRLTGAQMLYYAAVLHGLDRSAARSRIDDLAVALGLDGSLDRPVRDYSVGMVKKISLAAALIHSPSVLVLDEPFESVDPVSTAQAVDLLTRFAAAGGTVVLSSHNMDLVERVCDSVAVIVAGRVLAAGTLDEVRAGSSLEDRFVELAGGRVAVEGLEWLTTFSD
ncbi:MAG: ABC transporter ATP-binding protein [Micrococcales bacterium 32-70-13]|nr:MAG: ABC transporter ATP-binding protein [Micrococcales bacterium 32-70-13]